MVQKADRMLETPSFRHTTCLDFWTIKLLGPPLCALYIYIYILYVYVCIFAPHC